MIRDVIDHPNIIRIGDALAVTTLALTAAQVQPYIGILTGVLASLFYITKLLDWWRNERRD